MRIVSVIHVIQTAPKGKRKFCEVSHPIYCLEYMKIYMQFGLVKHLSHSWKQSVCSSNVTFGFQVSRDIRVPVMNV